MSNTLTSLAPDLYEALDVVSREVVGFIPSVSLDASLERAAVGQTVRSFVAPSSTGAAITAGQLPPDTGDQTIGNKTITISKAYGVPIRWNGEEQKSMNSGAGYNNIKVNQMAQAFRWLTNQIESDIGSLFTKASRAVGPAGTHLFDAANYKDIANARRILVENGAPMDDVSLVLNPLEGAAFRGNAQYYSQYASGLSSDFLNQGILMDIHGVKIRESQQVASLTVGTASSATVSNAGYSVGDTVLTLSSAGTGTILAGDVIVITGDASASKYVVTSGDADVSNGGTITIAAPGLKGSLSTATHAITIQTPTERNMMFSRNAIHLVTRAPARPVEGDRADDVMMLVDPRSGIAFEVAMYKEYRRVHYEVSCAWGYEMIKPEHCALLIDN
jgi:hypothetical protein